MCGVIVALSLLGLPASSVNGRLGGYPAGSPSGRLSECQGDCLSEGQGDHLSEGPDDHSHRPAFLRPGFFRCCRRRRSACASAQPASSSWCAR